MSSSASLNRREPAQILVIFAFAVVGLVALLALVVDGGNVYVQRRSAVTAADAGALAGTRALQNATANTDITTVRNDLTTFVHANGFGVQPSVACAYFVDTAGNAIAAGALVNDGTVAGCPSLAAVIPNNASGVHVDTHIRFNTFLAGMVRIATLDADAHSTSQVGVLITYNGNNAPLIACGGGDGNSLRVTAAPGNGVASKPNNRYYATVTAETITASNPMPTFTVSGAGAGATTDVLLLNGAPDPAKEGYVYYLKGSGIGAMNSDCGIHSSTFDGGAEGGQGLITVPGEMLGHHGNDVSAISQQVAAPGGCHGGTDVVSLDEGDPGCVLILPIADGNTRDNPPTLHIATWGAFYVWCNQGNHTVCQEFVGEFLPRWPAAGGQTQNTWTFGAPGGITVVHLTQ